MKVLHVSMLYSYRYWSFIGSACHNNSSQLITKNTENHAKTLQIVILWHCEPFIVMLKSMKFVVECINFDHVSCIFVRQIVQFHLITMFSTCIIVYIMRKHSVNSQFNAQVLLQVLLCNRLRCLLDLWEKSRKFRRRCP